MTRRVGFRGASGITSEDDRLALGVFGSQTTGALQARTGLVPGTGGDLTAVSAMVGRISIFQGWADGTSSALQGGYPVTNDANVDLTFANGNATNPRIDLVVFQVRDTAYDASGFTDGDVVIVAGTPAASPTVPATPASSIPLWQVRVEAGVNAGNGGINFATKRTDVRPWTTALGGITPARNSSDPITGAYVGQYRHRVDTGWLEKWNGTAWVPPEFEGVSWPNAGLSVTQVGSVSIAGSSYSWYKYDPGQKICHVYYRADITGSGTAGTYVKVNFANVPTPYQATDGPAGSATIYDAGGVVYPCRGMLSTSGGFHVRYWNHNSGNPWGQSPSIGLGSGDWIQGDFFYETAS